MLKILIPVILTPLFLSNLSWRHTPSTLLSLVPLSTSILSSSLTHTSLSDITTTDHLSAPLIMLTLWICAITIPVSISSLSTSPSPLSLPLMNSLLIMILIPAFMFNNLLLFYIAFESSLIPTLTMILLWGYQPDRLQASFYMMMYTISASLPLLLGILTLKFSTKNLNMFVLHQLYIFSIPINPNLWWIMCLLAFLVKLPLYSLHLWLPKAHVEAPTAGSMILASVLLKLGSYGLMRLSYIAPKEMNSSAPVLLTISILGASMTGLICMRQTDLKALIAYSSVAHMALVMAGISSMTSWGWNGALTMMLAHGLSSPALFSLASMTYELTNTRSLFLTKGLLSITPNMSMWWFMATIANMAAPPSINLMAEILLLTSILSKSIFLSPLIFSSSFLAAAYSLHLYTSTQHGPLPKFLNPSSSTMPTQHLSTLLLLTPIFLTITKPELISSWTP